MDQLQKAAVLLKHLSKDEQQQILSQLDSQQQVQLAEMIDGVTDISQAELIDIVTEYQSWLRQLSDPIPTHSSGESVVDEPLVEIPPPSLIDSPDEESLLKILSHEPGAVQAAVLCHLPETVSRGLFQLLTEEQRDELVERLPAQRSLSSLVWDEISLCLNEAATRKSSHDRAGQQLLSSLMSSSDMLPGIEEGPLHSSERDLYQHLQDDAE